MRQQQCRNSQQAEGTWSTVLQLRFLDQETICYRPNRFGPRMHGVCASTVQTENRDHLGCWELCCPQSGSNLSLGSWCRVVVQLSVLLDAGHLWLLRLAGPVQHSGVTGCTARAGYHRQGCSSSSGSMYGKRALCCSEDVFALCHAHMYICFANLCAPVLLRRGGALSCIGEGVVRTLRSPWVWLTRMN